MTPGTTISAAAESLLNPEGRFRTLRRIAPELDACGMPRLTVTSCSADFSVLLDGRPHLLRVPLGRAADTLKAEHAILNTTPMRDGFIAPYRYMTHEMTIYDGTTPQFTDIIIETLPDGIAVSDFIRINLSRNSRMELRRLLSGFADMHHSLDSHGIIHGHLRPCNIRVTPDAMPVAIRYMHTHRRTHTDDSIALLSLALRTYLTACEPSAYGMLWRTKDNTVLTQLFSAPSDDMPAQAATAARIIADYVSGKTSTPDSLTISSILEEFTRTPFVNIPSLAVASDSERPVHEIRRETPDVPEDTTLLVDWQRCDFAGPVCDTLVRFRMNGIWGFADSDGHRLNCEPFTEAADFYEGRAAVTTTHGAGLIDRAGNYIMKPEYEAIEWYGADNVAAACRDGIWNLYDRCGRQLTIDGYDWMAEPSEGFIVVRRNNRFGFITLSGTELTGMRYDEAFSFHDGRALVRNGDKNFYIDTAGRRTA